MHLIKAFDAIILRQWRQFVLLLFFLAAILFLQKRVLGLFRVSGKIDS